MSEEIETAINDGSIAHELSVEIENLRNLTGWMLRQKNQHAVHAAEDQISKTRRRIDQLREQLRDEK